MDGLYRYLRGFYAVEDFAPLEEQIRSWKVSRPFDGLKILDATPVFRNTMLKYCALLAGGAELTVAVGEKIPADEKIFAALPEFGIRCAGSEVLTETFDLIADCAGEMRRVKSRYGYVELTHSGLAYYRDCTQPVFSADSGLLKKFETILGTGDGFIRAMRQAGYGNFADKKVLIFGCGKVGYGIGRQLSEAGAAVIFADLKKRILPEETGFISAAAENELKSALTEADIIVSAIGISGVLAPWCECLKRSRAVIANMAAEDDFGAAMPPERVLNNKLPLNFILSEPTHLKYIAPTMALDNYGLKLLLSGSLPQGISVPGADVEKDILMSLRRIGNMEKEINTVLQYHQKELAENV